MSNIQGGAAHKGKSGWGSKLGVLARNISRELLVHLCCRPIFFRAAARHGRSCCRGPRYGRPRPNLTARVYQAPVKLFSPSCCVRATPGSFLFQSYHTYLVELVARSASMLSNLKTNLSSASTATATQSNGDRFSNGNGTTLDGSSSLGANVWSKRYK
jgi:hypothetical protein